VWRLDLGQLRWDRLPDLTRGRTFHTCCAVRGSVVVLGGRVRWQAQHETTTSVEIYEYNSAEEKGIFKNLPPLSCGPIGMSVALAIDESESDQRQVLLMMHSPDRLEGCAKLTWRLGCALRSLLSFALMGIPSLIVRRLGACQMGALFARQPPTVYWQIGGRAPGTRGGRGRAFYHGSGAGAAPARLVEGSQLAVEGIA